MKVYKAINGKKKISALAICLLLTVVMVVGGTLAYLFTSTIPVENTFTPAKVGNHIVEKNDGTIKKEVKVQNSIKGTTDSEIVDAYIRATFVVNWKDSTGEYILPAQATDYVVDMGSSDWLKAADGFYYYNKSVAPGDFTAVLIDSLKPADGVVAPKEGYTLNVEIISQSIQAKPDYVVGQNWTLVTASAGTLTLK